MHAGKVLVSAAPDEITRMRGAKTLEEAFIAYLIDAGAGTQPGQAQAQAPAPATAPEPPAHEARGFSLQRTFSYMWREALELRRDPVRATLALAGSLLLMFVMGFGISLDVEDLRYAVMDRDQTTLLSLIHISWTRAACWPPARPTSYASAPAPTRWKPPSSRCCPRKSGAATSPSRFRR